MMASRGKNKPDDPKDPSTPPTGSGFALPSATPSIPAAPHPTPAQPPSPTHNPIPATATNTGGTAWLTRSLAIDGTGGATKKVYVVFGDFMPRIPAKLLSDYARPEHRLYFELRDLIAAIAKGVATVRLSTLAASYPDGFAQAITPDSDGDVVFPWQALVDQVRGLRISTRAASTLTDAPLRPSNAPLPAAATAPKTTPHPTPPPAPTARLADTVAKAREDFRTALENVEWEFGQKLAAATDDRNQLREKNKELAAEIEALRAHATAGGTGPPPTSDVIRMAAELAELRRQRDEANRQLETLRGENSAAQAELLVLREAVERLDAELKRAQETNKKLLDEAGGMRSAAIADQDRLQKEFKHALDQARSAAGRAEAFAEALELREQELDVLRNQLAQANAARNALRHDVTTAREELAAIREETARKVVLLEEQLRVAQGKK